MSRKQKILIGVVLAPIICVSVTFFLFEPAVEEFSVTKANFDRVQLGMTREEVHTILGGASDHYFPDEGGRGAVWEGAEGNAYILFGIDGFGTVSKLSWIDLGRTPDEMIAWEREQIAWQRQQRWNLLKLRFRNILRAN